MINKFNIEDLDKLNNLLKELNCSYSKDEIINNDFINILVYDKYKGVLIYNYIYDRVEILYIIVDKKYRKLGIATRLLNEIENIHKNIKNITLEVRKSNNCAINFYKKNGFNIVCNRKNYYENEDGILMIKEMI